MSKILRVMIVLMIATAIAVSCWPDASWGALSGSAAIIRPAESSLRPSMDGNSAAVSEQMERAILQASSELASMRYGATPNREGLGGRLAANWPGDYRVTDFNLFVYFLMRMGDIQLSDLVRHNDLNPDDRPIAAVKLAELADLIAACNKASGPVLDVYLGIRNEEMVRAITVGNVDPLPEEATRMPMSVARRIARQKMLAGQYEGRSAEEVALEIRSGSMAINQNGLAHAGRVYDMAAFESLPETSAALVGVKMLTADILGLVGGWFVANGYTQGERLMECVVAGDHLTFRDLLRR